MPIPDEIAIGGRPVGAGREVFIIAEIGTSHGGDLDTAKELVERAAAAGADCAKFQLVIAGEIIHPLTGLVDLPGGRTPLYEVFSRMERPADFYRRLKETTEEHGLVFLCSAFGVQSADMLFALGCREIKIASPELNHVQLLDRVAADGATTVLSTGVSRLADIEAALDHLGPAPVALMHCVTSYPAPPEDYNLHVLRPLSTLFGVNVGVSDHSLDPVLVPSLAVLEGAALIEKHITLAHEGGGLDDPVALLPKDFSQMVAWIRQIERGAGDDVRNELRRHYGEAYILSVIGDGRKRLAASERDNYETTNRSVIAVADIETGDILDESNAALLRSEKNIRPGIPARYWPVIRGRRIRRSVPNGRGLTWDDLLSAPGSREQ